MFGDELEQVFDHGLSVGMADRRYLRDLVEHRPKGVFPRGDGVRVELLRVLGFRGVAFLYRLVLEGHLFLHFLNGEKRPPV